MIHVRVIHIRVIHIRMIHIRMIHIRMIHIRMIHVRMIHVRMIHVRMIHLRMIHFIVKTAQVGTDGRFRIQHKLRTGHHLLAFFQASQNFDVILSGAANHNRLRAEAAITQSQHNPWLYAVINQGVTRHLQYRFTLFLQLCLGKIPRAPVTALVIQLQAYRLAAQLAVQQWIHTVSHKLGRHPVTPLQHNPITSAEPAGQRPRQTHVHPQAA